MYSWWWMGVSIMHVTFGFQRREGCVPLYIVSPSLKMGHLNNTGKDFEIFACQKIFSELLSRFGDERVGEFTRLWYVYGYICNQYVVLNFWKDINRASDQRCVLPLMSIWFLNTSPCLYAFPNESDSHWSLHDYLINLPQPAFYFFLIYAVQNRAWKTWISIYSWQTTWTWN
jgi:hypothetical protein